MTADPPLHRVRYRTPPRSSSIDAGRGRRIIGGMPVTLIGYRGSGKTSVGRMLAERLKATFVDADEELVRRAGRSIKAIFEADGEAAFRDLESAVLADLLKPSDAVLSLGGGVVLREANRDLLRQSPGPRVYLRADAATLHARIHADPRTAENRPALTALGGGLSEVATLLVAREPLYRAVATHEIDVGGMSVEAVVERMMPLIPSPGNPGEG